MFCFPSNKRQLVVAATVVCSEVDAMENSGLGCMAAVMECWLGGATAESVMDFWDGAVMAEGVTVVGWDAVATGDVLVERSR